MHGDFPPLDEDIHISIPTKGPGEMQISSLELDTEQQPPEPGDSIQLRGSLESQWLKRYAVDEVFISFQGQPTSTIFIEIVKVNCPIISVCGNSSRKQLENSLWLF